MKKIVSLLIVVAMLAGMVPTVFADETLNVVAEGSNTADFSALVDTTGTVTDTSYAERTSADGWHAVNTAVVAKEWIGCNPIILNGKVGAAGVVTSGTLTGPLKSLSFSYGFPFADTQFSITISVKQNGSVVASTSLEKTDLTKETVYTHVWNLDTAIEGEYTLEIVNNCLSASTNNKDRLAIWNLTWSGEAQEEGETPEEPEEPEVVVPTDPKEIVDAAFELEAGASLPYEATLTGEVTSIDTAYSSNYGNITVTIAVEGTSGTKYIQCFRMKGDGIDSLEVGDTITVTGTIKNYNGIIEFDANCVCSSIVKGEDEEVVVPTDPKEIVDAAFALEVSASLPYDCTLTGKIVSIDTAYSEQYGNITVTMAVEGTNGTYNLMCYRLKGDGVDVLEVGDTITVTGNIKNYKGTIEFNAGCTLDAYVKTPQFVVDGVTTNPGGTVDVTVAVKYNPGIASIKLLVSYDTVLTLNSVVYNSEIGGMYQPPNMEKNPVTLNWFNGVADTTGDWVFATLTFTVAEDAAFGTYPITITYDPNDVYNIAETNLDFVIGNGSVTVACPHTNKQYVEQIEIGCETEGYMEHYTCPDCGAILEADGVTETTMDDLKREALGHVGEEFVDIVVDPGCETEGSQKITTTCHNCGEVLSEDTLPIEPTGHNYEADVTDPTCTEQGYTTYTCSVCGDSYKADYVEATGHTWEANYHTPTCGEDGYTVYTCACGESYVEEAVGSALAHSYDEDGICVRCGHEEDTLQYQLGDVDMDGDVDTSDAYLIVQHYSKRDELTLEQLMLANVDGDNDVDTSDAYWVVQYYTKLIDAFPTEQ